MRLLQIKKQQTGFSLLEAIVALTILAGASMALFGWLGSSLNQLNRAEVYLAADPALRSAMEYLKFQDLEAKPDGEFSSQDVTLTWQASPIEQHVNGTAGSNFTLSLYQVRLFIAKGGQQLPELNTRIVNYRLKPGVRDFRDGF